jgi:hypothetical protein
LAILSSSLQWGEALAQQTLDEENPMPDFDTRFPEPIVASHGSYPGGIELLSVFDRSQEAQDPLVPELWLSTATGDKLPLSAGAIEQALQASDYQPASEDEVWAPIRLALFPRAGVRSLIVLDPADESGSRWPDEALSLEQAWPPKLTRDGDAYRVELLQYSLDSTPSVFAQAAQEVLVERRFYVAKGRFEMRTFELWARGGVVRQPQLEEER